MDINQDHYITSDEYELLQPTYDCITEYSDGKIFDHEKVSIEHNGIQGNLYCELRSFFRGSQYKVYTGSLEVIFGEDEKHKLKPDLFVINKDAVDEMKGDSFTTAPKVIFEVITNSKEAIRRDKQTKYNIYEEYGVMEYNYVEPNGFIIQHALIDGYYQMVGVYKSNEVYKSYAFKDLKININDIFE